MNRPSLFLFPALLVAATFSTLSSIGDLPDSLATHFGTNGIADGWMTRQDYRFFSLSFLVGLPLLLVGITAGIPWLTNGRGQIPNSDYWFAEEHRQPTLSFLIRHACWLGCLTVAVVYGMHIAILRANSINPPVLATDRLVLMIGIYLIGLVWWVAALVRRFQVVTDTNA